MSPNTCEFKTQLLKLDIMVDKMKLFDYKNPQLTLKFKELNHSSVVRNGNVQFPCEIRRSHVFPGVRNLHKHSIFFLRPIGPFVPYSMRPKGKRVRPRTQ